MRIGIDGLPLTQVLTGIGHYTNELARHLANEFRRDAIEVISPNAFIGLPNSQGVLPANLRFIRPRRNPLNKRWWSIGLPRYIRRNRFDVFHGTNFEVPLQGRCPSVVTIHDLCMLLYPSTQERELVLRAQSRIPLMVETATMIITPTEAVRREVQDHLSIALDRIVAVPEAPRDCFRPLNELETRNIRNRLEIRGDFLLYVGTIEPRKNLGILLKAFESVTQELRKPLELVLAGRQGWLVADLLESFRRSPAKEHIVIPGYLSDQDLAALYSSCAAFIYPSVYEGFGLPPLEAMACGAPVIASRIPSLLEVAGSTALFFNATDAVELTRTILELLNSQEQQRKLSQLGLERAAQFSWSRTAGETRAVYDEAISRCKNAD